MPSSIVPVIMCGGMGTRLWPASRESMPKQFISLNGDRSTFQATLERFSDSELFSPPIVITNNDFRFLVAEQAQSVGVRCDVVLEPVRRDSGPAVAAAACLAAERDPDSMVLVLASDHSVTDVEAFQAACADAVVAAQAGYIVTFGIEPTEPSTSYGYVRPGKRLAGSSVRNLKRFVEKPDQATAESYIEQGYLWNSGNFLFRSDVMLAELGKHAPEIAVCAKGAVDGATRDLDFLRLESEAFSSSPQISIDHAVMEKTRKAAVLPAQFGWSDVGSWDAVWALAPRDDEGNAISGEGHVLDARNTLIRSEDNVVTTVIGLDDVVVVSSADAVLVTSRSRSQDVKQVVDDLKGKKLTCATEHRRGYRPWGYYESVDHGERYQVKRIVVKPGSSLSLQRHHHRAEHWIVVKGVAEVTCDDSVTVLHENQSTYLPQGSVHRLVNPGKIPLHLIEVQVGSYLGEDDIIRLEDVYNRETGVPAADDTNRR